METYGKKTGLIVFVGMIFLLGMAYNALAEGLCYDLTIEKVVLIDKEEGMNHQQIDEIAPISLCHDGYNLFRGQQNAGALCIGKKNEFLIFSSWFDNKIAQKMVDSVGLGEIGHTVICSELGFMGEYEENKQKMDGAIVGEIHTVWNGGLEVENAAESPVYCWKVKSVDKRSRFSLIAQE